MTHLLQSSRERLTGAADTVCLERARLITEAWERFEDEPPVLRRAHCFAHVLGNMTLDLDSNPLFAGNTSCAPRAWMLIPEHGFGVDAQAEIEHDDLKGFLDEQIPDDLLEFWRTRSFGGYCGIGHLAVDLQTVVHRGLRALLDELAANDTGEPARREYRRAMAICLEAVLAWADRYADAAQAAAREASDPATRAAHARVAEACRRVPALPARDLFEGLQAIILVHLAIALEGHGISASIGLPDRVLAPFVGQDFDADEATDLLVAFMLKIAANSVSGRASKTQAITIGGADHHGHDCSNALTLCFLEACDRVRLGDPHLFLRWHPGLPPVVKQRAARLLATGLSMPLLINDAVTARGFIGWGVRREDAWEYCVIGCNELGIPGRCMLCATALAGTVQYLELLNDTLYALGDPDALDSASELLPPLADLLRDRTRTMRHHGALHLQQMAQDVPTPFTSALMAGCIEAGQDLLLAMPYRIAGLYERGLTNAVNALAAIEQVVFTERALPLSALLAQMAAGYPDEAVRLRLAAAPRWGSDDERADHWAAELIALREGVLGEVDREVGDAGHSVCHVVRSLHHLDGSRIAASADGRLAGAPVSDSVGPEGGTGRQGPTGVLRSVQKLDAARDHAGGYNLNLTLPLGATSPEAVLSLVEGFFDGGGQELQLNCLDAATLLDAQAHPAQHGDLVVRVAGLSARFVDLSATEQNELIGRAQSV